MAENYYLIPNETVQNYMICEKQPKYLQEIGADNAYRKIRAQIGTEVDFFVVKLISAQSPPQAFLNKNDIVDVGPSEIVKQQTRNNLAALGVDMNGITNQSSSDDVERRLYSWLIGESKTTAEVFAGR